MKIKFPTAFTVIFFVIILTAALTHIIPAGKYNSLSYDKATQSFKVIHGNGTEELFPATQETLDNFDIQVKIESFLNGDIWKPIGVPNSYQQVEANPQNLMDIFNSPIQGIYDAVDIIVFVLIIGGFIGVMYETGAFDSGIQRLAKNLKGKENWLIVIVTILIAIGGTTFGMAEETIAFYPLLVPVFLAAGFDVMVALACIYVGSSIGTMASTVNPFSTIIASNVAGVSWVSGIAGRSVMLVVGTAICIFYIINYAKKVKANPSNSLVFSQQDEHKKQFLNTNETSNLRDFNLKTKLTLILFGLSFAVMVYGVSQLDWWFTEMTVLFLVSALIIGFIEQIPEEKFVKAFIAGASDLIGVALIIGLARGVTIIMDNGLISDTILFYASDLIEGMSQNVFIVSMMGFFSLLCFFISSSSGLAVISMPIIAPLADVMGIPREIIVNSYQYGMGLMSFITPTGLILASLMMVNVTFDKWLKFIMPLLCILIALSGAMLIFNIHVMY